MSLPFWKEFVSSGLCQVVTGINFIYELLQISVLFLSLIFSSFSLTVSVILDQCFSLANCLFSQLLLHTITSICFLQQIDQMGTDKLS